MKVIVILIALFVSFGYGYTQGILNVSNNATHTTSGNASYTGITLGNNSLLRVKSPDSIYCSGNVSSNNGIGITVDAGAILHVVGSLTGSNNVELNIAGKIRFGSVDINNNGHLTILGSGEVNIVGNLTTGNNTSIIVDPNSTLNVSGNLTIDPSTSTVNVNGVINVGGDYSGPAFTGNGTVYENGVKIYPTLLPITLSYFGGTCNDGENEILWVTSSENNSSHFILERSDNATEWKAISQVQAAGQSSEEIEYIVNDADGGRNALSYYRLHQYDFNGENAVYGPISIVCENPKELKPTGVLAPNPTAEASYLTISNSPLGDAMITLLGTNGQIIYTERLIVSKQNDSYFIDSLDLNRGSYIIRFEAPDGQIVALKLVKN